VAFSGGKLAGAALGTRYGAYKTKNDCGTIFGDGVAKGSSYRAGVPIERLTSRRAEGETVAGASSTVSSASA